MAWMFWILLSAIFLALYDLCKKASVRNNAVLPTLFCSSSFGCIVFVGWIIISHGIDMFLDVTPGIIFYAASKSVIVATSWIFTFTALRSLPISIATPIRASAPALVFLMASLMYGEIPTAIQGLGMIIVFSGYFLFSWAGSHEGIDFFRNRAVWCAILGALCSAISAIWDKYVFQIAKAPVESVQLFFQIGLVIFYAIAILVQRKGFKIREKFEWRWTIPFVGILLAMADWLYFTGISIEGTPISVASLLRRFSVVITFLLGAKFFHETNLLRKGIALSAILVGIILLCIGN